jgi:hypothetical protein
MSCNVSSSDQNTGCLITFPSNSGGNVPVPSGPDGLLSWDSTTLQYVNTGILPFQVENLIGIPQVISGASNPTQISTATFGTYHIIVNPTVANYPTISFSISKSNPLLGTVKLLVHSGIIPPSGNRFQVIWPPSSGIRIQKILASEDGTYQVTITGL